jgi:hypothetical protein
MLSNTPPRAKESSSQRMTQEEETLLFGPLGDIYPYISNTHYDKQCAVIQYSSRFQNITACHRSSKIC